MRCSPATGDVLIRTGIGDRIRNVTDSDCAQLDAMAPAFALGGLEPGEVAFVRAHVVSCARRHPPLRDAVELAAAIGAFVPDEDLPSAALRTRVLDAIRNDSMSPSGGAPRDERDGRRWRAVAGMAGTLAIAASLALAVQLGERAAVTNRLADTDARIAALEADLVDAEAWIERAVARGADAYFMDGEGEATAASFMLVVEDGASGAVLLMSGLPLLSEAETYELWVERDGAIVAAGTFRADEGGLAAVTIDASLRGIRQAMITVEPAGGSAAPSENDVVMQGDLSL